MPTPATSIREVPNLDPEGVPFGAMRKPAAPLVTPRKRGNPNWGQPFRAGPRLATEFEIQVRHLRLNLETYASSVELRRWCELNRNRCYIPEWLLEEWGITVDSFFSGMA